jgi:protein-arginine kinase activator protein McsA
MTKIHEILKLNLEEDIKSVIDIEDRSEAEVKYEIDSYIVTENIGKYFSDFASKFTSNIKETGVWISGFYGSGKSYFGKMLGYVLENSDILGTPAVERFTQRLAGLKNAGLVENDIRSLSASDTRVVTLDIAKQSTAYGLAFALFRNFLKSLGFLDNVYGYIEYSLFLDDKYENFLEIVKTINGAEWPDLRKNNIKVPLIVKKALTEEWYSEKEYEEMRDHLNNTIKDFSANKLKEELQNYLDIKDEKIVFIFDEASEAISQKKYELLDLEGLSEAMSGISAKVWTIAIAQEKLDDVISNSNISKSQLIKVTDRFKTKIHLESTEVDIIIRNRLLQKKDEFYNELKGFYKKNEGILADATNLKSSFPTKVENADECATYYPFHKYQFDLLQRFLFSSKALAATQVAARGMIITTFDVLRRKLKNRELFEFAPAYFICDEAQTAPPSALVNKYDNAQKILKKSALEIDGDKLLKTIHFLTESELVPATSENITKTYSKDIKKYYDVKPEVDEALNILTDAKILLFSNNTYKITSDLETKLLDEMNDFNVELFIKKRNLITNMKKLVILKSVSGISTSTPYSFNIISDLDDEIFPSTNKNLQIRLYSLYSVSDDREEFIETVKLDTQYEKGRISIIPENKKFKKTDTLLEEIQRLEYMQEKYGNDSDPNVKQIIREFGVIKDEKEKDLKYLIDETYAASTAVYLFDTSILDENTFTPSVNGLRKKVIKNVYTKRPSIQLSEKLAKEILKEKSDKNLYKFNTGDDFKFFDNNGNFIGDNLKVTEEVTSLISNNYADGKSIEVDLMKPPTGYEYGTVATVLAALFRAGRVTVKYKGSDYFSYKDKGALDIFSTSRNFQKASFKALTKSLNTTQKNEIVQVHIDLKYKELTGETVDWNTNDFQLVDAIRNIAEKFITIVDTLRKTVDRFDTLFSSVNLHTNQMSQFTGKTTESNYIDRANLFLNSKDDFKEAAKGIRKIEKFVKKNLEKSNGLKRFVDDLEVEMEKAAVSSESMTTGIKEFKESYKNSIVDNFKELLNTSQKLKDEYFGLMKTENEEMSKLHTSLKDKAQDVIEEITQYPEDLNTNKKIKADGILKYAEQRINTKLELGKSIQCKNCNMSLSEMKNSIALIPSKETELILIQSSIVKEKKKSDSKKKKVPKKIELSISRKMTVKEYRKILSLQLQQLSGLDDNETVEIDVEER